MKLRTIVVLTICVMITCTYALYNIIAVPILFYVWMTIAFLVTSKKKQIKLNCIDFLNKYSWSYLGVSVLLVLLATVNSIGYQNRSKEYQKVILHKKAQNDTIVFVDSYDYEWTFEIADPSLI